MHKYININAAMNNKTLPARFCWTRIGTESGDTVESILARKERERLEHSGMFLWGIGNSVGPAIRELVRLEKTPQVLFSPMRAKAKAIDTSPSRLFTWMRAVTLGGNPWEIPDGLQVVSRAATAGGELKRSHYALVCRSAVPLQIGFGEELLCFDEMVNLVSQNKLGHSQVTSVVHHRPSSKATGATYRVGFASELVYPYFVQLEEPKMVTSDEWQQRARASELRSEFQKSLLLA